MGEVLGQAGVSVEGGGAWGGDGVGHAHFLFADGERAAEALRASGITVRARSKVIVQKLNQEKPGQMDAFTGMLAARGVSIKVLYSDHYNQLIVVPDNYEVAAQISREWTEASNAG